MKKKILLLSTDTLHHRFFINALKDKGHPFNSILFETTSVKAPFTIGPFFKEEENAYEQEHFFHDLSFDISGEHIVEFENINNREVVSLLNEIQPDLGVVFGTRKLSKDVIGAFKDGLINVHRGIAQKYRGLDSDLWAVYHRDIENIGVTLHQVDLRLDTGDVLYQSKTVIPPFAEIYHLRYLTTLTATDLCIKALNDYKKGEIKLIPQKEIGRYYSFMPLCIKEGLTRKFKKLIRTINV